MGNCPSSFRAQFKPDHENSKNCQTDIILTPVEDKFSDVSDEKNDSEAETAEEEDDVAVNHAAVTNGTTQAAPGISGEQTSPLKVEDVDLCTAENTRKHRTDNFNINRKTPALIARRGSPINLQLKLNRPYVKEKDIMCLVLNVKDGVAPSYALGTQVIVPILTEDITAQSIWPSKVISSDDNVLNVEFTPLASAIVGEWIIEIDTKSKDDLEANTVNYKVKDSMILLFNPWCKDDSVYLSKSENIEEYVMGDSGLIWRGTHNRLRQCVWNYSQFEDNILECCLYLLTHIGNLSVMSRADPVLVVQHLSSVMSSTGKTPGVLVGNWCRNSKGGQSPISWSGSQQILEKFYKTKKPVKYGQCWVYSGILTTVCRALGIPSRPVTNYLSAHNTQGSLIVDSVFDEQDRLVNNANSGSIWNFHVWTEVWMQRPDLEPGGYDGWQVIDITAQNNYKDSSNYGPASVSAIKRREVKKLFDTSSLLSEVDAQKVYWRYHGPNKPLKLLSIATGEMGLNISTKAVGKFEREDITHEYKETECEEKEMNAKLCSLLRNKSSFTRYDSNADSQDVHFTFVLPDDVVIGEAFRAKLLASNKNVERSFSLKINLSVDSVLYTGQVIQLVKKDSFGVTLSPGVEHEMTMNVNYSEYAKSLSDQCLFVVSASAHVKETGFDFFVQEDFRVRMPHIGVQINGEFSQNQPMTVTASFTNPLPFPLKRGVFVIDGPALDKPLMQKLKGCVLPKADVKATLKVTPKYPGVKTLVVKFTSKELTDVEGYHVINVKPLDLLEKETNSHL